jgi:hypothetical protein
MAVLSDRLTANGLRVLGGAAILAAIIALVAHFAFADTGAKPRAAGTTPTPSASAGDGSGGGAIVGADGGASPDTTGDPGTGGGNGNGNTGGGRATTPPPSGPTIHWYKINSTTKCAAGQATISVQIAWHVTGADSVALSVDNPGLVGSYKKGYKLDDAEWLTLDCGVDSPPKAHVWTIYTVGGGPQRSQTINAKATPAPKPTPSASAAAGDGGQTP